jgi:phosphate transport system substrate-binding protein
MRLRYKCMWLTVAALTVFLAGMFSFVQGQEAESIRVKGSESPAWMVDLYAKEFIKDHPAARIVVSGGQGIGWKALLDHECEIAMASRRITDEERRDAEKKGLDVREKCIGWGGIVIIVHPSNPVNELTVEQVRTIFSGQTANWKKVGGSDQPIAVLTIGDERPGTLYWMQHDFLHAPLAPNSISKSFFRAIISGIGETGSAASFVRVRNIAQLKEQKQDDKVKIVAIKANADAPAILPSRETVDNGTYPITRPYFMYLDAKGAGKQAQEFMEYCSSKNPRGM